MPEVEAVCAANVLPLQCLRDLSGVCTGSSWYTARDLNPEPADLESAALPIELAVLHHNDVI